MSRKRNNVVLFDRFQNVVDSTVFFLNLLPQNFRLGEPILLILFYVKAGTFRVAPFQYGPVLGVVFLLNFYFLYQLYCTQWYVV